MVEFRSVSDCIYDHWQSDYGVGFAACGKRNSEYRWIKAVFWIFVAAMPIGMMAADCIMRMD